MICALLGCLFAWFCGVVYIYMLDLEVGILLLLLLLHWDGWMDVDIPYMVSRDIKIT